MLVGAAGPASGTHCGQAPRHLCGCASKAPPTATLLTVLPSGGPVKHAPFTLHGDKRCVTAGNCCCTFHFTDEEHSVF